MAGPRLRGRIDSTWWPQPQTLRGSNLVQFTHAPHGHGDVILTCQSKFALSPPTAPLNSSQSNDEVRIMIDTKYYSCFSFFDIMFAMFAYGTVCWSGSSNLVFVSFFVIDSLSEGIRRVAWAYPGVLKMCTSARG